MKEYLAYIDESGEPNFNEGASKTYFVGAVFLEKANREKIGGMLAEVKRKFGLTELKSSKMNDFDRRMKICQAMMATDFRIATLHVAKDRLNGDWFRRKTTFYKYIHRRLSHEIYSALGSLSVSIDKYGSPEYQDSFKRYLEQSLQRELFEPDILIASARESSFLQMSDFIIGSIRKALEGDFQNGDRILELFRPIWPIRKNIPDEGRHVRPVPVEDVGVNLESCMQEAWRYLVANEKKHGDPKVRTLEYLYYSALDGSNQWVYTHEILDWLRGLGLELSEEQFRNEVTASLRDEGLIIVGSRKGIKIPLTADDFREYITFSVNLAIPVLRRLKKAITFIESRTSLGNHASISLSTRCTSSLTS